MENYLTVSLRKYVNHMRQEGLSKRTIEMYRSYIRKLAEKDSRLYRISNEELQAFILESNSESGQNCKINAIKKYFDILHPTKRIKVYIRPKPSKKVIEVLSKEEVWKIINNIHHFKQRTIISGLYLHGLRISEILNLRYKHIDRSNGVIHIVQSKGKKDRIVPLHETWIKYIIDYSKRMNHNTSYAKPIFQPYSESSIRNVLNRISKNVEITKNVYPHLLRDSYASHLILDGYDISQVQEILGHNDIKTSRKYIHFSAKNIRNVKLKINT